MFKQRTLTKDEKYCICIQGNAALHATNLHYISFYVQNAILVEAPCLGLFALYVEASHDIK